MNAEQIAIVRATWKKVQPQSELLAQSFFERLFELRPELRQHLGDGASWRRERLLRLMNTAVSGLERMPLLLHLASVYGQRQTDCPVRPADYASFGAAWLSAMRSILGRDFCRGTESAWTCFYGVLSRTVRHAQLVEAENREVA